MRINGFLLGILCAFAGAAQATDSSPGLPPSLPPLPDVSAPVAAASGTLSDVAPKVSAAAAGAAASVQNTAGNFPELRLPDNSSLPPLPALPSLPGEKSAGQQPSPPSPFLTTPAIEALPVSPKTQTNAQAPVIVAEEAPLKNKKRYKKPAPFSLVAASPSMASYRCVRLPETLYKKTYDRFNRGLPVAYYESDYDQLVFIAIAHDDLNGLRALLDEGRPINLVNPEGDTPLLAAVKHNAVNAARLLLARHANANAVDITGRTPLQIAMQSGNFQMVRAIEAATSSL